LIGRSLKRKELINKSQIGNYNTCAFIDPHGDAAGDAAILPHVKANRSKLVTYNLIAVEGKSKDLKSV
jgi:hypothetical protein